MRCFEDFQPGEVIEHGSIAVTEADIVAFAGVFDAQPFHVDPVAAKATFSGGLIASGWHTSALMMRMLADGLLLDSTSQGSPGIEELRWLKPVRPGMVLSLRITVVETRPSRSRPDLGSVLVRSEVLDETGDTVEDMTNWIIFARRGHAADTGWVRPAPSPPVYLAPADAGPLRPPAEPDTEARWLEDLVPGTRSELGSFTFTAGDIIAFARAFDPQRFHVDEAAAEASLLGGLCASGWHTGAAWMRCMAAHRGRIAARHGAAAPQLGPSPGFRNLRWMKPVFAGDTISYASELAEVRASASRPGWGLAFHRNSGVNQRGEAVFGFDGCVFWQRRPG